MSFTWALRSNNDMAIMPNNNNPEISTFVTVSGRDEVRQRIRTTLLHEYEEYFLNVPGGTPWYEVILGSKDYDTVTAIIRQIILSVPGVISIIYLNFNISNRQCFIDLRVEVEGAESSEVIDLTENLMQFLS